MIPNNDNRKLIGNIGDYSKGITIPNENSGANNIRK
jgi:hypothetical protein